MRHSHPYPRGSGGGAVLNFTQMVAESTQIVKLSLAVVASAAVGR